MSRQAAGRARALALLGAALLALASLGGPAHAGGGTCTLTATSRTAPSGQCFRWEPGKT